MFPSLRAALRDLTSRDLAVYASIMPPSFIDGSLALRRDAELASQVADPRWLGRLFSDHSVRERIGADALLAVSERLSIVRIRRLIRQHGLDEARHAEIFTALARLFPPVELDADRSAAITALEAETTSALAREPFSFHEFLTDTHVSEVDSLHHLTALKAALAQTDATSRILLALDTLIGDERFHVFYTARLLVMAYGAGSVSKPYIAKSVSNFYG